MGKTFRLELLARAVNMTRNFLRLGSIVNSSKIHFDMDTAQYKTHKNVQI